MKKDHNILPDSINHWTACTRKYFDGRTAPKYAFFAEDAGIVLKHGDGPDDCDIHGAREAIVYEEHGVYHLFYDGSGAKGWLACLATSKNLVDWTKHGPILDFGRKNSPDSAAATAPWVVKHNDYWHMFYLGTPHTSPAPDYVPSFPYLTLKARSKNLEGPWTKQYDVTPWKTKEGSWRSLTASPGYIIEFNGEFIQFMSGSAAKPSHEGVDINDMPHNSVNRTVGIARTKDLNGPWRVDEEPLAPGGEQIENSSIYFEESNNTWFLFTNHIGISGLSRNPVEFTDAIWVYWSKDPLTWNPEHKAVVVDGSNCGWSKRCIGMPAVIKHQGRLAILFDGPGGTSTSHMKRDIGLAWLDLPLDPPHQFDLRQ